MIIYAGKVFTLKRHVFDTSEDYYNKLWFYAINKTYIQEKKLNISDEELLILLNCWNNKKKLGCEYDGTINDKLSLLKTKF